MHIHHTHSASYDPAQMLARLQAMQTAKIEAEQRRAFVRDPRNYQSRREAIPFLADRYGEESRVSTGRPCPICAHTSLCLLYGPRDCLAACYCGREESAHPITTAISEGWLHELPGSQFPRQRVATVTTAARPAVDQPPRRTFDEWLAMQAQYALDLGAVPGAIDVFAESLGLPVAALTPFGIGWCAERQAYSAPMRGAAGEIIGLHLRALDGAKFAVTGSRNGLFLPEPLHQRDSLTRYDGRLLIVEGLTDAAALASWGCAAVGRNGCDGGRELVEQLVRRLQPRETIIVADNDLHGRGLDGARRLAMAIAERVAARVFIAKPPAHAKDVREWLRMGATASDLAALLVATPAPPQRSPDAATRSPARTRNTID